MCIQPCVGCFRMSRASIVLQKPSTQFLLCNVNLYAFFNTSPYKRNLYSDTSKRLPPLRRARKPAISSIHALDEDIYMLSTAAHRSAKNARCSRTVHPIRG